MKTKNFRNANYVGWIVIILAFAFIYCSYFFVYIPNQKSDLTQRAFRILKEYGNNMVGKYGYYETHFRNYGIYYSIKYFQDSLQIEVRDTANADYKKINSVVQNLFPYIITGTNNESDDVRLPYSNKESHFLSFTCHAPDTESKNKIYGVYKINSQQDSGQQNLDDLFGQNVINQVPFDKFMEGLKFDELFENIILFNTSKVYYNSNLDNLADITNPGPLCDSTNNSQGGVYKILNIRGKDKHIMILPIEFDGKPFYIAGLISDTNFKNITSTFNSRILMLVAGILLLIFVGMPVLKTMFIGPKERLKTIDVAGSAVSILFGSALFVLIIISFFKNQFIDRSELSDRIEKISDALCSNVNYDIDALKLLGNSIAQKDNSQHLPLANSVISAFDSRISFFQSDTLNNSFPLNEIILIDSLGYVKKALTRTPFSDAVPVNLGERTYFKNAVDTDKSWPISGNGWFFLESIQSYNTGKGETAISFPTTKYRDSRVLAVTSEIPSLYHQVLPKDIMFVLMDKTGKVLYHSKKSKNLHENFIEECESDPGILNAVQLNVKDRLQIKYNEKKWLARIVPIKDTPLYHITLLDLNQTDNKNARIFLITFYFMLGLQLITIGIIILLRLTFKPDKNEPGIFRFFKRLAFLPSNYNSYKGLVLILVLIALAGISSFVTQADLVNVLMLQFLNVGYTFFASLVFLKRDEIILKDYFKGKYYPENLIFAGIVFMIIMCFWKIKSDQTLIAPVIILLFTTVITPLVFRYFDKQEKNPETKTPSIKQIKSVYLAVLFMWLVIFSVIPVMHSYFSVMYFEEKLWQQQQQFKVAEDNFSLSKSKNDYNSAWFKRIQGNGIDRMKVSYISPKEGTVSDSPGTQPNLSISERIYASLPDPISNGYSHRELLAGKNQKTEWNLTDSTLYFPIGGQKGAILVSSGQKSNPVSGQFFLLTLVFLLAAICIWQLVKFAATVFLNLDNENPTVSDIPWHNVLNDSTKKRILLKSYNGDLFLSESVNSFKNVKSETKMIDPIQAVEIYQPGFNCESHLASAGQIIWICGLNECIPEVSKHNLLLDNLASLNHNNTKKIVIDLPFELDLIDEFYNDYIASNELTTKELTDIFILRKKWRITFENYISYNGYIYQGETDEPENKLTEKHVRDYCTNIDRDWCHSNIWRNLTYYEKIVLYDLADDGLMNRNNRAIIGELIRKKLILINPFPSLFTREFTDYIYQHISKSDIKVIEGKLGLKEGWRNTKYLILLIIIPLAAFIFISQGLTIEKSFGIFAGVVGAIGTLMKLFETSTVKK